MTQAAVTPLAEIGLEGLRRLLHGHGLRLELLPDGAAIPGSYWGEPEAGLVGNLLYLRPDTPVHSVLHEACHFICMDESRRAGLHTDAGGTDTEENAVCYLQALLAPGLPGYSRERLFADMDAWGFHFILGSAAAWFAGDAQDARAWLLRAGLIDSADRVLGGVS
ncbi:MAG: hypothetical protein JOY51_04725 [Nevskia sp.]|nr:hypothetical protein [Nevskia sp.]